MRKLSEHMARPLPGEKLLQYIMADKIVQADNGRRHEYKYETAFFEKEKHRYKRNDSKGIKIFLDGDEMHEFLHHWGLKMRVDPVE